MLTELSIRNFAIIDEISISFQDGLTVLTGETGAGKSIIIDAIQLLAGGRGSTDFVRHKSKKAEIEGLFFIENKNHPIFKVGKQYGIDILEEQIVLERIITNKGRSICRVNGKLVTLSILREFGKTLVDIHSQHETQSLLDADNHLHLLDLYAKEQIQETKNEYKNLYNKLLRLKKRYKSLNDNEQTIAQRLDFLQYQLKELEQANLQPEEDLLLEKERHHLINYERIYHAVQEAYNALYGEQKGLDWLNLAQQTLQDHKQYDEFIDNHADKLSNYYFLIEEITFQLRDYAEGLEYQPERLNEIEARLDEINHLKKKYGTTIAEIIEYNGKIAEEIEQIKYKDSHLNELYAEIEDITNDAILEAKQLHDLRQQAATSLTKEIHKEFQGLYLEKARFSVSFMQQEVSHHSLHENGFDHIQFMISTNPGEPLKELDKVASGGELSRIMLALKRIFAKHQRVTSVIFDEVDTGVSGRVAQAIAEKIYRISNDSQVLCITHLPQVAAMADTHLFIKKEEKNKRIVTNVHELTAKEQIEELSRMITGSKLTTTAIQHGKELLDMASEQKTKMILG